MTYRDKVLQHLADGRIVRSRVLTDMGIPRQVVFHMVTNGELRKIGIGYQVAHMEPSQTAANETPYLSSLMDIGLRYGQAGLLCLWSALRIHELTEETEFNEPECVAIPRGKNAREHGTRDVGLPAIRIIQWSDPKMFEIGIYHHEITPGLSIHCTDPVRTVLDLYAPIRSGIPEEVAAEALLRLVARDESVVGKLTKMALQFNWEKRIEEPIRIAQGSMRWFKR
jgi:hypothetical protein